MNTLNKMTSKFTFVAIAMFVATMVALGGTASARTAYNPAGGNNGQSTPVFNDFYNVPDGVGDEADFVRVKPKAAGNGSYIDTLNSACNIGDTYNVRTYVHNGANPNLNGNGSGSAVAHNVKVALQAELGTAKTKFRFASTVTASNAASVSDTGYLNCNGKTVKLSLVERSVQTYSKAIGFKGESDSVVNGAPFKVGSQAHGSGDQWGCWDDRIIVVYEVKVEEVPVVIPTDAICKIENGGFVVIDNKKRTVSGTIKPQLTNATVTKYTINWGDGAVTNNQSGTHSYATDGKFTIAATMEVRLNDGTVKTVGGSACMTTVEFKPGQPPVVVVPPTTTVVPPTVTKLVSTGPASIFSIFAATSLVGAVMHRIYTARKATQL